MVADRIKQLIQTTQKELCTPTIRNSRNLTQYHNGVIRGLKLALKEFSKQ
jgi:hypothetical protein